MRAPDAYEPMLVYQESKHSRHHIPSEGPRVMGDTTLFTTPRADGALKDFHATQFI